MNEKDNNMNEKENLNIDFSIPELTDLSVQKSRLDFCKKFLSLNISERREHLLFVAIWFCKLFNSNAYKEDLKQIGNFCLDLRLDSNEIYVLFIKICKQDLNTEYPLFFQEFLELLGLDKKNIDFNFKQINISKNKSYLNWKNETPSILDKLKFKAFQLKLDLLIPLSKLSFVNSFVDHYPSGQEWYIASDVDMFRAVSTYKHFCKKLNVLAIYGKSLYRDLFKLRIYLNSDWHIDLIEPAVKKIIWQIKKQLDQKFDQFIPDSETPSLHKFDFWEIRLQNAMQDNDYLRFYQDMKLILRVDDYDRWYTNLGKFGKS